MDPFIGDLALKNRGDFDLLFLCEAWRLLDEFLFVVLTFELNNTHEDFVVKYYFVLFERFYLIFNHIPCRI